MFLIQWGIDGRYSPRRVSRPPPPTFSTRLSWVIKAKGMVRRGCRLVLGNRIATAGGHVTRTSMSLRVTVVCMRWRTPECNLYCRQNQKPPFIHTEISTLWKDGFEKDVFGLFLTLTSGIQDIREIYWPPKMSALAFLLALAMQGNIITRKTDYLHSTVRYYINYLSKVWGR